MSTVHRQQVADLQGASRLAFDAVLGVTGLVETMHHTIQLRPGPVGRAAGAGRTRGITGFVYRCVRGTTRVIGTGLDAALSPVVGLLPEGMSSPERDAAVSALNGVYGDHLAGTGNPLAIEMELRYQGKTLDLDEPGVLHETVRRRGGTSRLLLMVHGLCLNERHWQHNGHDHGAALAAELGLVPVYLRYNSGLPVAANGQALAARLERLYVNWPGKPPRLAIVGHSMGGLVARSACHHAEESGQAWRGRLRDCVFLGTPHHGAPLERAGHRLDQVMDLSPYVAPFTRLGKARSAGIADLRHGNVTARAGKFLPLPARVRCHTAAATLCTRRGPLADRLLGDGLVPLNSALGAHADSQRELAIPKRRQWIGYGLGHMDLLSDAGVYAQLQEWLRPRSPVPARTTLRGR
jgi:pimeloyl-ACP methyl ester carboxylesterase